MERLKGVAPPPGQKPPILVYLGLLLQKGKLNGPESAELARCGAGTGGAAGGRGGRLGLGLGWPGCVMGYGVREGLGGAAA